MVIGIYKITCKENNRIYIGSAKNLNNRWLRHLNDLKNNKHVNIHLQRAFNKYGEGAFIFDIIEKCEENSLFGREQYYLDNLKPEFNIGKNACGGDNLSNNPNKEDIINRIKETVNKNISSMTEEERKKKWGNFGSDNPNYGNRWNDFMKKISSDFQKNNINNPLRKRKNKTNVELYGEEKAKQISEKLSKIASERIGDKNGFYDKHHTDETKKHLSENRKGKYYGSQNIFIEIDGIIYSSYGDASKKLNIPIVTIRWRCLSKNPKFDNYKLV